MSFANKSLWLGLLALLLALGGAQAQQSDACPADDCQRIFNAPIPIERVTSLGINEFALLFELQPNPDLRYFMYDLAATPNVVIMRPDNGCQLLLAGFRSNSDSYLGTIQNIPFVDVYAYCTSYNLTGGASFPRSDEVLWSLADDGAFAGVVDVLSPADDAYPRVRDVLSNASSGTCPMTAYGTVTPGEVVTLNDFATQIAFFIAFDDPVNAFEELYNRARNPIYIEQYDSIYCLLGVDPTQWHFQTSQADDDTAFTVDPTEAVLTDNALDITATYQKQAMYLARAELQLQRQIGGRDELSAPLEPLACEDNARRLQCTYRVTDAGPYRVRLTRAGAPLILADTGETELTVAMSDRQVRITAPEVGVDIEAPTPWYLDPLPIPALVTTINVPLLYFVLIFTVGLGLGGTVFSWSLSNARQIRRETWLKLLLLVALIAIGAYVYWITWGQS